MGIITLLNAKWIEVLCLFQVLYMKCVHAQNFVAVDSCPKNKIEWTQRATAKNCRNATPDYMCAAIQDNPGILGEICTLMGLANNGTCAVLSKATKNLDFLPCKAERGCPLKPYKPSEMYSYPVCFENFYGVTTGSPTTPQEASAMSVTGPSSDGGGGTAGVAVVGTLVVIILLVIVVLGILLLYRRNKLPERMQSFITERIGDTRILCCQSEESHIVDPEVAAPMIVSTTDQEAHRGNTTKIHKLFRYVHHILKKELEVCDLKEQLIIYSASLKEHFNTTLLNGLNNVKHAEDYDDLDMKVVFALLMNLCSNIKPPTTGWGYKPRDDDFSTGADLERIRTIWNVYCDNHCNDQQLNDVYGRMLEKYGENPTEAKVANPNEDKFEDIKSKIDVVRLKRDCNVEDGIVVTENIKSALTLLETSDVIICRGAIGCGKTTAMRYIQEKYEDKGWRSVWFEEYVNEDDLRGNEIQDTLLCCDNLFGTFNCCVFSSESVTSFEDVMKSKRERYKEHLKVVLGIHQHVYDEVMKFSRPQIFENKKSVVEMDALREAELLLIWKELKKEGHCVRDPSCYFKSIEFSSVLTKLSLNQGSIGNPFLLSMYTHHHDLFANDNFTKSPVTTLVDKFNRMREENKELFYSLVYILYVRVHIKGQAIRDWAGLIDSGLTKSSLEKCAAKFPGYLSEDYNTLELKHELLNIALFKECFEIKEILSSLVHHCDKETVLQVTRIKEECDTDFVNCLPSPDTDDEMKVDLLKKIADAKGVNFKRPTLLQRKWKKFIH
ncbi:uncharacterized protein LOC125660635 [Ostrea edulis]|uniref:uncharacterized protein LOC125660635 n=1 Tax=Ostrea edulis TaxID=37623 RepID=UPI0024AF889F|nr:uncharacterized protein LOC125660635 [Ostrea edulis]